MDPTKTAEALASGSAQLVLAIALVAVTLATIWLGKMLYSSLVGQVDAGKKDMVAQIASNQLVADALKDVRVGMDGMTKVVERALDMKGRVG